MEFYKKLKAVWNQEKDFLVFKSELERDLKKRNDFYTKEIKKIDSKEDKKELVNNFRLKHEDDLLEFQSNAREFYEASESDKKDQFKDWKSNIFKVFIGWFLLMSADKITGTHLIAQYFVLIGGVYITWKSLIDISLLGQRASFARNCIRNVNILRGRKFCYLDVGDDNFKNQNGLTEYYVSITKSQISQHKGVIKFLIIGVIVTILYDIIPIVM